MPSKMNKKCTLLSIILLLAGLLLPQTSWANAFFIQEVSGDGMGQANATVAAGDKPSTLFQNAANISFLDGLQLELVMTTYIPNAAYTNPQGEKTMGSKDPLFVPHFFATYKINEWCAVGFGAFVDFGLTIDWPEAWEGAHLVEFAGLNSLTLNPNVSFGPFKGFVIAVGLDAKWGAVEIKRRLTLGMPPLGEEDVTNRVHMAGQAWGFGGNIGLMYQPADWVRIGASYRSMIRMAMEGGDVDFDVASPFSSKFPDQHFDAVIDLPHLLNMGVRFWPIKNQGPIDSFSIELDLWVTFWSSYDMLTFNFDEGLELGPDPEARIFEQSEVKDFNDFIQIRLGSELDFLKHYSWRFGVMLDGGVIPDETLDPMLPDNHRVNFSTGFGTEWSGFFADLAYMFVYMIPRDVSNVPGNPLPGKYAWYAHVLSLSLGYHYDFAVKDEPKVEEDPSPIPEVVEEPPEAVEAVEAVEPATAEPAAEAVEASEPAGEAVEEAPAAAPVEEAAE